MILEPVIERLRRANPQRVDQAVAVVLATLGIIGAAVIPSEPGRDRGLLGIIAILAMTLPLAFRRHRPLPVLVVIGAATVANSLVGNTNTAANLGVLFALYTVAVHSPRGVAISALLWTFVGITVAYGLVWASVRPSVELLLGQLAQNYLVFGAAWLLGDLMRSRAAYAEALEARNAELLEQREENARLAVVEERTRIARELHDIVAHHVSVMVVQATAARRTLESRSASPGTVPASLATIEETGRDALTEMRRMLRAFRTVDAAGLEPQPGLDRLDDLLHHIRDAGLPVDLEVAGTPTTLPTGVELSAYRIIQEGLTNTLRHGGRARARVTITYGPGAFTVEVIDDGRGAAAALDDAHQAGHGLIGMHERVALLGGTLEAGPEMSGGYRVVARIPLEAVNP
jgi:signal transduction histidine kinase